MTTNTAKRYKLLHNGKVIGEYAKLSIAKAAQTRKVMRTIVAKGRGTGHVHYDYCNTDIVEA